MTSTCLLCCFFRSYFLTAGYNPHGLQNIGFAFAMQPGLEALYSPGPGLQEARARYISHFNCHPFFASLLLGIFLRLEKDIAKGVMAKDLLLNLKDTSANTLSAIGDALFSGGFLPFWVLTTGSLILADMVPAAIAFTVVFFLALQCIRFAAFVAGWRMGFAAFGRLAGWRLILMAEKLKYMNAVLLAVFITLALPDLPLHLFVLILGLLLLAVWFTGRLHASRWILGILFMLGLLLFQVSGAWLGDGVLL